ncbi:tail fiber assembly protein [Photorhabdus sp. SF281]
MNLRLRIDLVLRRVDVSSAPNISWPEKPQE